MPQKVVRLVRDPRPDTLRRACGTLRVALLAAVCALTACEFGAARDPLSVAPRDTTISLSGSVALRAAGVAAFDPGPGVQVTPAGVITPTAVGRHYVVVHGDSVQDTVWVSVVPPGTVVAVTSVYTGADEGDPVDGFQLLNLDGSASSLVPNAYGTSPSWGPDAQHFVYTGDVIPERTGYPDVDVTDLHGHVDTVVVAEPMFYITLSPEYAADGHTIYFIGGVPDSMANQLFRVNVDGSGLTRVRPPSAPYIGQFDLAHHSERMVFVPRGLPLRLLDLATNTESSWTYAGSAGHFSPDDSLIAADGSELRLLDARTGAVVDSLGPRHYVSWSPDGTWVMVSGPAGLSVINRYTKVEIPLPAFAASEPVAWRP